VSAALEACHPALTASARSATFVAQMAAIGGTRTMAISFQLLERPAGRRGFHRFSFPPGTGAGFGSWQTSTVGISMFSYKQTVVDLPFPAAFRVLVRYRWLGPHGVTLRSQRRLTPVCQIPDERPNLVVAGISGEPGVQPGTTNYAVHVGNDGLSAAGPFSVALSLDGRPVAPDLELAGLAAHARQTAVFVGPSCGPGQTLRAVVDSGEAIDEKTESDNSESIAC
jgi:hypothetical protein